MRVALIPVRVEVGNFETNWGGSLRNALRRL